MLTVQYKGKGERTVGGLVVYPGELLTATPNLLAAWQAEHGDVFVVIMGETQSETLTPPVEPEPPAEAEPEPAATEVEPKAKRK